jgi:hypothetical protein
MESLQSIIKVIKEQELLQTAGVTGELVNLEKRTKDFNVYVESLDPGTKGSASQFFHQLIKGGNEEKTVMEKLKGLGQRKASLTLQIQVAGIGVQRDIGKNIVVNAEAVKKVDGKVQKLLGKGKGLKLAERIENKPTKGKHLLHSGCQVTDGNRRLGHPRRR